MWLLSWFWLLCAFSISSLALHETDVGVVDWYKPLIGVPMWDSTFTAPAFAKIGNRDLIITATGSNVLAALSVEDGSVVWRYVFEREEKIMGYYPQDKVIATLSGPGGAIVRTFDIATGELLLERPLHSIREGLLLEPAFLGASLAFDSSSEDIFTVSNAHTVTRLDGTTGAEIWKWNSPHHASKAILIKVLSTPEAVYAIGAQTSLSKLTLQIFALSPTTGELIESRDVSSKVADAISGVFSYVEPASNQAIVAWAEEGSPRTLILDSHLQNKPTSIEGITTLAYLIDLGLSNHGQFLGQAFDGGSQIMQISPSGTNIVPIHDFDVRTLGVFFGGGLDRAGQPYIARTYWSTELNKVILDVIGGGEKQEFTLGFETNEDGIVDHFTFRVSDDKKPQVVVTSSTGAVQAFSPTDLQWSRQESLATAHLAEFVELPERIVTESTADKSEGFFARLIRQVVQAQNLPQYLINFIRRFVTGSYASATSSAVPQSQNGTLYRDAFGFRQIIVTATTYGKVFGIDSSNGNVLWSRSLGLGSAINVGGVVTPKKMYVIKTVSDGTDPEVVIIAERRNAYRMVATVVFHINALSGADLTGASTKPEFLEGIDILDRGSIESYLLEGEKKVVIVLSESLQPHLYPDNAETQEVFQKAQAQLSFPIRTLTDDGNQQIVGHKFGTGDRPVAYPTWSLTLPDGEQVQRMSPPATKGPIASLGKVLGNRTTLYKYLNPRLVTTFTVSPTRGLCGLYLLDATKGTVVYHTEVKAHSGVCDMQASLTENWLVYHYYEGEAFDGDVKGTKGYRLVTVELYEGHGLDEKTRSSDMSSYVKDSTEITAYEQSYIFPHAITTLAPTTTKFGITSKDFIFATKNNKIQSFPRRYLNPRRTRGKPTAEEQEEGLIVYDPLIPDDPKRVLSHDYQVAGIKRIVTAPAVLESTSMVFAFGLDMFLTRVAPSSTFDVLSENFNKAQLVITIGALAAAILFTKPMVQRKRLREKWYQ
ncbi:DUF1620-domain-containing protein [Coprinopsis marcescibilis]|uniref:ER membrane protein complex subunit 1 n=1 Tax=Coprinopsis marcescibilis TaxID=230819 RepID=A0A5C3KEX2_COPMA|nr:DUF1620-domain-containing protein [Coprinopsis marcescibilis]